MHPTSEGERRAMEHLGPLGVELREIAERLPEGEREVVGRYMESVISAITPHARREHDPPGG